MNRSFVRISLAGLLAIALLVSGCGQIGIPEAKPASQPASAVGTGPASVQVAKVQRGTLSSTLSFSGNVQARQKVSIIPKVSGRVTKLAVDIGSVVAAGDVLLQLDQDALQGQVAQAQAGLDAAQAKLNSLESQPRPEQVAQAEANLKAAQAKLDQLKAGPTKEQLAAAEAQVRLAQNQLYLSQTQADAALGSRLPNTFTKEQKEALSGVGSEQVNIAQANLDQLKAGPTKEQLDQAEAAVEAAQQQLALAKKPVTEYDLEAARAAVAQAKAAVDLAKVQLAEATVKAPFSGIVAQRLVSEGAMVGPGSPVLTLISTDNEVIINIDESDVALVKAGQPATITASAYPGEQFSATVTSVAPSVDAKTRTSLVRLSPDDKEGKLRDGMFAQVQMQVGKGKDALLVPKSAVVQEQGSSVVYIVQDGQVRRQVVTTGVSSDSQIEIVSGLSEGQSVAITGLSGLRDGAEVKVQ